MKKLHELELPLQVEIVKAAGEVLARNLSWTGNSDSTSAANNIITSCVDAFLSLYPDDQQLKPAEEKNEPEKIDEEKKEQEEKNPSEEVAQKRKYTRRNTE